MATYLQGVTDYIPQVQPFAPDFNFYAKSLQFSQGKADAARKQLSNIYGSLLNSPLTREDNTEARQKFFKTIDQDIQRMAGMDLSLQQNVSAAKGVFNQMLDNKSIVKDMVWTKQWQGQQKKSQSFKNCVDPEKCGGAWWEGGDTALQYNKQEFIDASPEDAMRMGVQSYVPYQDITKRALDMAKEADLNVSIDQVTGQWITTTKNGPQLIGRQLQELFMGSIGKDPKVKEYMMTKASNQRKGFMYSKEAEYGSKEAAEQAYLQQVTPTLEAYYNKKGPELEDAVTQNEKKIQKIEKAAEDSMPDEKKNFDELIAEFQTRGSLLGSASDDVKETNGQIEVAKRNQKYTGRQADAMIAGMEINSEIGKAAEIMSYRNYEQTVKINPYGMEAVQQRNRFMFERLKQKNRKELEHYKAQLDGTAELAASQGGAEANSPRAIAVVKGAAYVGNQDPDSDEFKQRGMTAFENDRDPIVRSISNNELNIVEQTLDRVVAEADNGDAMAKEDFINIFNAYVGATKASTEDVGITEAEGGTFSRINDDYKLEGIKKRMDAATTTDQKYAIAKEYNADWKGRLRGGQVDYLYEKSILPMIERGQGNDVLRDYLAPVWTNNMEARAAIKTKKKGLELYDQFNIDAHKKVMGAVKSSSNYSKKDKDILDSYIDNKGHVVTEDAFVNNMMNKNYSEGFARGAYRHDVEDPSGPNWIRRQWNYATGDPVEALQLRAQAAQAAQRGAHDLWVESFTRYNEPDGDTGWLAMTGAGDGAAMGLAYDNVDPSQYRSLGMQGTTGALKDATRSSNARFSTGGFETGIPEDKPDARRAAGQLLIDLGTMTKATNTSRPIMQVTSANVAGGNDDYMAVNIKMSEAYRKKYHGSENNKGLYHNIGEEGFTMYIPKDEATNLFYTGTKNTVYEQTMKWQKEIEFDSYPKYLKNTKLESLNSGGYKFSGYNKVTKQDGTADWDYFQLPYIPYTKDLNGLIDTLNSRMYDMTELNKIAEETYKLKQKQSANQN